MKEGTAATHVIFAPAGIQQTPQSENIDFSGPHTFSDEELCGMISYAQLMGLQVILKPTVNCANGVWRAHINFFDNEVPCEPKWRNWFASHEAFQLHYAALAEKTGCVMFITGCEMVMAQRREAEWRDLIAKVKQVYSGPVSYNTDKYQEDQVRWWDCVDVISSSGYYPFESWGNELDRIETVVKQYRKPFFFAEAGCMSIHGSGSVPNDWSVRGAPDMEEQARWFQEMFMHTDRCPWMQGFGMWEWPARLYSSADAAEDISYCFYAKPAERAIAAYYAAKSGRASSEWQPGPNRG